MILTSFQHRENLLSQNHHRKKIPVSFLPLFEIMKQFSLCCERHAPLPHIRPSSAIGAAFTFLATRNSLIIKEVIFKNIWVLNVL